MKLDEFVSAANLARYQRMLDESTNADEREIIRKLLAEELAGQDPVWLRTKRDATACHAEPEA